MYLQTCGSIKSSQKRLGLQIANPQSDTLSEGPQLNILFKSANFVDLRFEELNCGPPTFGNCACTGPKQTFKSLSPDLNMLARNWNNALIGFIV